MKPDEITSTLTESIGAVLRQKHKDGKLLVPTGTLDGLIAELANNSAAPLALFLELEAQSEYGSIVRALDSAGIPNTRDGIADAYTLPERISLLAQQRNAAEAARDNLRDCATALITAFEDGDVDLIHQEHADDLGNDYIDCPEDDTCKCPAPAAFNNLARARDAAKREAR
jgi:hypothetical protein